MSKERANRNPSGEKDTHKPRQSTPKNVLAAKEQAPPEMNLLARPGAINATAGAVQLRPAQVLGMQHALGNRAVQRLLAGKKPQQARAGQPVPQVQRWEGGEHAKLGDSTGMTIDLGDGVVLTWGQVIAIAGDEIGSLQELEEAVKTPAGKAKIRAALEAAGTPGAAASTLPAPTPDQKKEQEAGYYKLLLDNATHFQSGGMALDEYRKHHSLALDRALRAGIANPAASTIDINQAYLAEAFGQHFLTDMFSAGHIRTPRSEIAEFYTNTFAPRVIDNFINNARQRLEDGLYAQAASQSRKARWFEGTARERIRNKLNEKLNEGLAELKGGKAELTELFGKGLAGVISGAIHDAEGARGTMVSSVNNPTPWKALGDSGLDKPDNAVNKQEAELAVKAGLADVQKAYEIGQKEGALKQSVPAPSRLPDKVYFKFNSDALIGGSTDALEQAAAYLIYNPDTHLEMVGHTDPIGDDAFNDGLGMRRAESVTRFMLDRRVPTAQISTSSRGEQMLVTSNPKQYNRNRRVEFLWTNRPPVMTPLGGVPTAEQIAFQRALDALKAEVGPPYFNVENFLPQAVTGMNPPLPDWHWGSMSPSLEADINAWVAARFTPALQTKLLASDKLNKITEDDIDFEPRPIVQGLLAEINANPMAFLRKLFK